MVTHICIQVDVLSQTFKVYHEATRSWWSHRSRTLLTELQGLIDCVAGQALVNLDLQLIDIGQGRGAASAIADDRQSTVPPP